jgi:urease accessory protein
MLRLTELVDSGVLAPRAGLLTLRFEDRRRSRMRVDLDDGREAALLLPRGTVLRDGDRLRDPDSGVVVTVRAAAQTLSFAHTDDPLLLARAAYHLGNRHVPVEVGPGWLAYEHDHVLDGMVAALGLPVDTRVAPFEPEAGGYGHGKGGAPREVTGEGHVHHHHEH